MNIIHAKYHEPARDTINQEGEIRLDILWVHINTFDTIDLTGNRTKQVILYFKLQKSEAFPEKLPW
jgi:hypothetical protein